MIPRGAVIAPLGLKLDIVIVATRRIERHTSRAVRELIADVGGILTIERIRLKDNADAFDIVVCKHDLAQDLIQIITAARFLRLFQFIVHARAHILRRLLDALIARQDQIRVPFQLVVLGA